MFFLTAPLHLYALFNGSISGCGVKFLGRDATKWSSFQNSRSLIIEKLWALLLMILVFTSAIVGTVGLYTHYTPPGEETHGKKSYVVYLIGTIGALMLFNLLLEPVIALFFFDEYKARKKDAHKKSW